MSQMSTTAVLRCKYCGRPVYVTELSTTRPDPNTEELSEFISNLHRIAMCPRCQKAYNYYASVGRLEEFLHGATAPIILTPNTLRSKK